MNDNLCYLSIAAGTGGAESCAWTAMLSRMYGRWAETKKFFVWEFAMTPDDVGGYINICYKITGNDVYHILKKETGVHSLCRISPFDPVKLRHTSFAAVLVSSEQLFDKPNWDIRVRSYSFNPTYMGL